LADEIPSSTTPPNWDDYPTLAPPLPALPDQHVDANARSTSARIAAQPDASACSDDARTAAQPPHAKWPRNGAAMQVESTDFLIQNVESTQPNSIQTAYTPTPVVTQQPQGTTLRRRSNVDGSFYSHEFDHEEVIEVMDESRSQISSVDEPWNGVCGAPKRVYPTHNGSLRERTLPSVRVQELAEPGHTPSLHSSKGSLRERARPSACVQKLVEPYPPQHGSLRERTPPGMRVQEIVEPRQTPNGSLRERSPPGARVQETAEPPSPMDELRQLAAELNRRLGLVGHGSGPADGLYPAQPPEQGMPSVARQTPDVVRRMSALFNALSMNGRHQLFDQPMIQTPISTFRQEMPMARPIATPTASILMEPQPIARLPQRPQPFTIPPELTKSSMFFRQGHDPRQTMSRNTPDRR